jgi:hypothetical protein
MIRLRYSDVISHHIREPPGAPLSARIGHGDLLVHEIQVVQMGIFRTNSCSRQGLYFSFIFMNLSIGWR